MLHSTQPLFSHRLTPFCAVLYDDQKMLTNNSEFLNQKIRIMVIRCTRALPPYHALTFSSSPCGQALMEMVLKRGSTTRKLTFAEIAKNCDLGEQHVSVGLCDGVSGSNRLTSIWCWHDMMI